MNAALAPVAPKLAKLVLVLSSDKPGEVVSAASAIGRTLKSVGADWHDFAGALLTLPPLEAEPKPEADELVRATWLRDHGVLSTKEQNFVDNVILLVRRRRKLSEKQAEWLEALYAREGGPEC